MGMLEKVMKVYQDRKANQIVLKN